MGCENLIMKKLYDILKKTLDKDPLILNDNNNINWWKSVLKY